MVINDQKPRPPEFLTENRRNTLRDNELATVIPGRLSVTHPGSPILTVTR